MTLSHLSRKWMIREKSQNLAVCLTCVWFGEDARTHLKQATMDPSWTCAQSIFHSVKLSQCLYDAIKKKNENLDLSTALCCYFVFSSGNPPPHTHTTIAEARNPLTKPHSVIICLVQECFTFWCYNSFVCSSFGQANHCSRVSMRENKLLENKGWELQGFFPASQFSHQPGSASHMLLCWPDKMMTRYNHTL